MAQKPIDSWQSKTTVKKGNIGEKIVRGYLENKGYVIYKPITSGGHPFDNLCASRDKKKIFIVEVKTKEARKYYPDTGIDIKSYNEYKYIQDKYNLKVFLFFVDATNRKIYGNIMEYLEIETTVGKHIYPLRQNGIIYFPLSSMKSISELTENEAEIIRKYNTKKYDGAWKYIDRRSGT